jgi:glycosyltransferase involved in cell wall biosynthesis
MTPPSAGHPLHILVLVDRDWTHHDAGGNGANILAQASRWVEWGHRVTVVTGSYPGAKKVEHFGPRLTVHRAGNRATVFPLAFLTVMRGVARDADVVLEVINGITFLTPLWLRKPRVAMVHHVHRELYMGEFGRAGLLLYWLLEKAPLSTLYRRTPVATISNSARDDLARDGIPKENISVEYLGLDGENYHRGARSAQPRIVFVGRLKAYKNVEALFDVIEALPGVALDVVGEGDHRPDLEQEIERRGLGDRVVMHGYVDQARKTELYGRAWVNMTASQSEGWSLAVIEAAMCATPTVAMAVGGLTESVVDGETGLLARNRAGLTVQAQRLIEDHELRERMGDAAERRARTFTWDRPARANLEVMRARAGVASDPAVASPAGDNGRFARPPAPSPEPQGAPGTTPP